MQNYKALDWLEIIQQIQGLATSGTAKLNLLTLSPLPSQVDAEKHLQDVFDVMQILGGGIRPYMESLDMFEIWHGRLKLSLIHI